jgi:hypothetical protein
MSNISKLKNKNVIDSHKKVVYNNTKRFKKESENNNLDFELICKKNKKQQQINDIVFIYI